MIYSFRLKFLVATLFLLLTSKVLIGAEVNNNHDEKSEIRIHRAINCKSYLAQNSESLLGVSDLRGACISNSDSIKVLFINTSCVEAVKEELVITSKSATLSFNEVYEDWSAKFNLDGCVLSYPSSAKNIYYFRHFKTNNKRKLIIYVH